MKNKLFSTMNDLEDVCVNIEKLQCLASTGFDLATPCNANDNDQDRAFCALYEQPHIATTFSMIIDYLTNIQGVVERATDEIGNIWKATPKESEVDNGKG